MALAAVCLSIIVAMPCAQPSPCAGDNYRDGTPDFLRLHDASDRFSFRQWFTLIAEIQALRQAQHRLPPEIDDCAALLRYAYLEALRIHDAAWLRNADVEGLAIPPPIQEWHYPFTRLHAAAFRTRDGAYADSDLSDNTFAQFADANTLRRYNMHLVGREIRVAQPGDLLFFRQAEQQSEFHSMIFVGESRLNGSLGPIVVYHTGSIGKHAGEVRRLTISDLLRHPDARWRPVSQNPNFLGVYRWNILREN